MMCCNRNVPHRICIERKIWVNRPIIVCYFLSSHGLSADLDAGRFLMGFQLIDHNPLRGIEYFSPGRWRMIHTNAVAYGFLANAFLGAVHWAIPRLTMRPVTSVVLSWLIFWGLAVCGAGHGWWDSAGKGRPSNGERPRFGLTRWRNWVCCC